MNALALIVGNSKYPGNELKNPENDATDFSNVLERLGFSTILKINVDQNDLNNEIDSFGKSLEKYDIGLFYFAGHGLQIQGENFLTVINTNFETETSVQYSSITLNKILTYMERAQNKTNILILDACRDNPYERRWTRSIAQSGLAPMYAPKGTLIAYATSPGQRAKDGTGRNGLYTSALLKHILDENITVEEFFKRVRNSVYAFSNGEQTSWEHTSLTGTFIFNAGQLIHSIDTPYASFVISDRGVFLDEADFLNKIIADLKSYNWYVQNPAISRIYKLDFHNCDKNKLFLLGRNILQAADGHSGNAISFMDYLDTNLKQFSSEGNNHILNGILFEMYFDSDGMYRGRIKSRFLENIANLSKVKGYEKSFEFIKNQLLRVDNSLFYIPGKDETTFSFDVSMQHAKTAFQDEDEYYIKAIKFEGEDVLKPNERNPYFGNESSIYYEPLLYKDLKEFIGKLSGIPYSLLTINTNYEMKESSKLRFPLGYVIKKS